MRHVGRVLAVLILVLGLSADVSACPNCKEAVAAQPGEQVNMQNGFNWSILFMITMPFALFGTGAFMVARGVKQGVLPEM